ncbi:MAG: tetratricopeptide repeat protein [Myxococcota bacterium]
MESGTKQRLLALFEKADFAAAEQIVSHALRAAPSDVDTLVMRARLRAFQGAVDAAMIVIDRALKASPSHHEARATKAALLVERGKVNEAKVILTTLVGEPNAPAAAHFCYGSCLAHDGAWPAARLAFEKALQLEPDNVVTQGALAEAVLETGDAQRALALVSATLEKDPGNGDAWLVLARAQLSLGHEGDAMRNLQQAVGQVPRHVGVRELLATTLLLAGDADTALLHLEQLSAQLPNDAEVRCKLGLAYAALERLEESEQSFRLALKFEPDNVLARLQLVALLDLNGSREALREAVKLLKEAVRSPVCGYEVWLELGRLLTTRPAVLEGPRGFDALERARRLMPDDPEPLLQFALVNQEAGRGSVAREAAERVMAHLGTSDAQREMAKTLLQQAAPL